MEQLDFEKIKQVLISLLLVNDMKIPQRWYEIKSILKEKKYKDDKFKENIEKSWKNINNNKGNINLSHVKLIKKFEKDKDITEENFRTFHMFEKIEDQIAVAAIIHDEKLLNNIAKEYSEITLERNKKYNLFSDSKNFGNISSQPNLPKCEDKKNDSIFFTFYNDWKEKWSEFVYSFENLEYNFDSKIALKIDFKNSYYNLNRESFKNSEPTNIKRIFDIADNYVCKDCELEDKINIKEIVPYGGILESHILANILIFDKVNKIIEQINSVSNNFKVDRVLSYADDITFFIKVNATDDLDRKRAKSELIDMLLGKKIEELKINLKKSDVFYLYDNNERELSRLLDSYTSISVFNALKEPETLLESKVKLKISENTNSENNSRTFNALKRIQKIEELSKYKKPINFIDEKILDEAKENKWIATILNFAIPNSTYKERIRFYDSLFNNKSFIGLLEKYYYDEYINAFSLLILDYHMSNDSINENDISFFVKYLFNKYNSKLSKKTKAILKKITDWCNIPHKLS
ncbi:MAG: hypothetical protein HRT99_03770, partial [Mycoplasmatales bacterium]|nr:hypothetical protein [Mycoplasmatales bacterium]